MNETSDIHDDPFGRRVEVTKAWEQWRRKESAAASQLAASVVINLGRCRVFGVEPAAADVDAVDIGLLETAIDGLHQRAGQAAGLAATLEDRWDDAEDTDDAEELCMQLIRIRTDLWGAEMVLEDYLDVPETLALAVDDFDEKLRQTISLLATIGESSQYVSICDQVSREHHQALPWWLGDSLKQAAEENTRVATELMPPTEVILKAQAIRAWKDLVPTYDPGVLAAKEHPEAKPPIETKLMKWRSADGQYVAVLRLPSRATAELELLEKRPIQIFPAGDETKPAVAYSGKKIRLGGWFGELNADAKAMLTIREITEGCDGLLWVNEEEEDLPWTLKESD